MTNSLKIIVERCKDTALMVVRGRIDIESSPYLRDQLLALLQGQAPPRTIVIDLAEVAYMDTSGIATLVEALKVARLGNIPMHLHRLQGRLLYLLQSTGIGALFGASEIANSPSPAKVS